MKRLVALRTIWLALLLPACMHQPIDGGYPPLDGSFGKAARSSYIDSAESPDLIARAAMTACPSERARFHDAAFMFWGNRYRADYDVAYTERLMREETAGLIARVRLERGRGRPASPGSGLF
jgi:hypothetical protein